MKPATENKIRELLKFAKTHGLAEMAWQENGLRVYFRRGVSGKKAAAPKLNGVAAAPAPVQPTEVEEVIKSPMVGVFRRSNSKDRPPIILEGNHVKPGDRLGFVESMKIPTDVISFNAGTIAKIMVEEGQVVEYGQPLFVLVSGNGHMNGSSNGKK